MSIKLSSFCFLVTLSLGFSGTGQCQSLSTFIPKNYALLDSVSGDLNMDAYPDVVLILKIKAEQDTSNADRPLLILQGISKGNYKLVGRNDHVVFCASCGGAMGDPYQGVSLEKGSFTIMLYGGSSWRWTQDITFAYLPESGKFILHSDKGESFQSTKPNKVKKMKNQKENWDKISFADYSNDDTAD